MKLQDLVRRFPLIWHATFADGMESILGTGLRCATSLLAAAGLERDAKVFRRDTRRVSVAGQTVVLRDQLRHRRDPTPSLDGITAAEWWALINARVYFFTRQKHLHHLVTKYSGLGEPQDVLTLDTGRLLAPVVDRVEVTTVNAGAFPRKKGRRRTAEQSPDHALVQEFLALYDRPDCFYDWGDDPSFFMADRVLGDARRASWGVCRRDVRSCLRSGDIVVYFCGSQFSSGWE